MGPQSHSAEIYTISFEERLQRLSFLHKRRRENSALAHYKVKSFYSSTNLHWPIVLQPFLMKHQIQSNTGWYKKFSNTHKSKKGQNREKTKKVQRMKSMNLSHEGPPVLEEAFCAWLEHESITHPNGFGHRKKFLDPNPISFSLESKPAKRTQQNTI